MRFSRAFPSAEMTQDVLAELVADPALDDQ